MKRPQRVDYAACECARAQEEGESICGGCDEYTAALGEWTERYDPYEAADARADDMKDEDIQRG